MSCRYNIFAPAFFPPSEPSAAAVWGAWEFALLVEGGGGRPRREKQEEGGKGKECVYVQEPKASEEEGPSLLPSTPTSSAYASTSTSAAAAAS